MSDTFVRRLERTAARGDAEAQARLVVEAARRGEVDPRLADCVQGIHRIFRVDIDARAAQVAFGSLVQAEVCIDCRQAVVLPDERRPECPEVVNYMGHVMRCLEEDEARKGELRMRSACGHWFRLELPRHALAACGTRAGCGGCEAAWKKRDEAKTNAPTIFAWLLDAADRHDPVKAVGADRRSVIREFWPGFSSGGDACVRCQGSGEWPRFDEECPTCKGRGVLA